METERLLFRLFEEADEEIYLVGGRVRDRLLGKETLDLDFATSAMPAMTMDLLREAGMKPIPIGMAYGTVSALAGDGGRTLEVQITTFRRQESYSKGSRHPSVVFGGTLEEDLARRDFTVNAMAMDSRGRIMDPLGGLADLRAGILRTPLDPVVTFGEDPLRMLRAFRFSCRLGFTLDRSLIDAVRLLHREILGISRERWKGEMDAILGCDDPASIARVLRDLMDSGLLGAMIPELDALRVPADPDGASPGASDVWEHTLGAISRLAPSDPLLRWAALLHDIGKPARRMPDEEGRPRYHGHEAEGASLASSICDRFRFSRREKCIVVSLVADHMHPVQYSTEWGDAAIRRLRARAGANLDRLLALAEADIAAHTEPYATEAALRLEHLRRRLDGLRFAERERVLPRELGELLLARTGPSGGVAVGSVLAELTEAVHRGELPAMGEPGVYLNHLAAHPGFGGITGQSCGPRPAESESGSE